MPPSVDLVAHILIGKSARGSMSEMASLFISQGDTIE